MKPLTFTLRSEPGERLDLSGLIPDRLSGMPVAEIAGLPIGTSRSPAIVGDIFKITGADAANIVFAGGSGRFDFVGAEMKTGRIRVDGDVGARAGRRMAGGTLVIEGKAGLQAGSGLKNGRIEINGDAGEGIGGPMAGEIHGMTGGLIIVRGKAGHRPGERMRRGIIALLKGCGDYAGLNMVAGTIVVTGRVGHYPGHLMKRGSLLFDRRPADLSPTFMDCGRVDIAFPALFDRYLMEEKILDRPLLGAKPTRLGGDNAVLGKGEIMFPRG
ncbi:MULTISPECIES: formylmethanofuran dehydrogenase subunit C [Rhizobium/Agrobacterium group]|uniref:Formylmethanofuran dehydrogenase subunit C n=2 Tax=Neorhizobium TaxID=1525371 RepID=A0ABV0M1Y0_9HYPH|nr:MULTISPECIES: formylmethanofuran dehydrogenase subunit C [Rhizobium/Agrobacterium group]KGD96520.1 formylmethanofuran dehydrogenase [Rhizobium sp. YS-1r]MCC2611956.1 formylmethanofuran dehydrogenase subunit C [Neorhizobium petrolearium]WGI67117.1 formylmethanofuran dehydrogenase subunit C [Neorhizobium petrolearium]